MKSKATLLAVVLTIGVSLTPLNISAQDNPLTLYMKRCASCHGADGAGKTAAAAKMKVPDLRSAAVQGMSDTQLFDAIGKGANHTTYPHVFLQTGMSEIQVRSLVAYLRSFAKK